MKKLKTLLPQLTLILVVMFSGSTESTQAQQKTNGINEDGTINPLVQVQTEEYSSVRKQFRTTLIKNGGSPQKVDGKDIRPAGVSEITFPSGNLRLKGWISKFEGSKKKPVVIFLHGGFAFGKEDWEMTKPLQDAGFIVVAPILRGENNQPGTFTLFYDEVNDAIAVAAYLRKQRCIDKNRIYISGHSAGGTVALLAAMSCKYFRKAASFSGSPDQMLFCKYGMDPSAIPFDTTNKREFEVRSPLAYAYSFKCPARIYYGKNEAHFRLSSRQTAVVAKQSGLDIEAIEVEGGHETAVTEEMKLAITFFNGQ